IQLRGDHEKLHGRPAFLQHRAGKSRGTDLRTSSHGISLHKTGCAANHYVDQPDLELAELPSVCLSFLSAGMKEMKSNRSLTLRST
ncbi:mCG145197, partial [Mus musculus]